MLIRRLSRYIGGAAGKYSVRKDPSIRFVTLICRGSTRFLHDPTETFCLHRIYSTVVFWCIYNIAGGSQTCEESLIAALDTPLLKGLITGTLCTEITSTCVPRQYANMKSTLVPMSNSLIEQADKKVSFK